MTALDAKRDTADEMQGTSRRGPLPRHWIHHDDAERATRLLVDFFVARPRQTQR
jgi:hypothetical protein